MLTGGLAAGRWCRRVEKVQHRFVYLKIQDQQMKHLWEKGNAILCIGKDCMLKTPMGSDLSKTLKRDSLTVS